MKKCSQEILNSKYQASYPISEHYQLLCQNICSLSSEQRYCRFSHIEMELSSKYNISMAKDFLQAILSHLHNEVIKRYSIFYLRLLCYNIDFGHTIE